MTIQEFFTDHPETALAFSGGVDSAYLMWAAKTYGRRLTAYYVKTPFQPDFEYADAVRLAQELGVTMKTIRMNVLEDETVRKNPKNRCYFCKQKIFNAILSAAKADGFSLLMDGTNASDDAGDRPGMQALKELHVLSPLRMCGLTKDEIRKRSKEAGLFTHDKPAYACLATRIPAGTEITLDALQRTQWAEGILMNMGFSDFRVRNFGNAARIQVKKEDFQRVIAHAEEIENTLKEKYDGVLLDLAAR